MWWPYWICRASCDDLPPGSPPPPPKGMTPLIRYSLSDEEWAEKLLSLSLAWMMASQAHGKYAILARNG